MSLLDYVKSAISTVKQKAADARDYIADKTETVRSAAETVTQPISDAIGLIRESDSVSDLMAEVRAISEESRAIQRFRRVLGVHAYALDESVKAVFRTATDIFDKKTTLVGGGAAILGIGLLGDATLQTAAQFGHTIGRSLFGAYSLVGLQPGFLAFSGAVLAGSYTVAKTTRWAMNGVDIEISGPLDNDDDDDDDDDDDTPFPADLGPMYDDEGRLIPHPMDIDGTDVTDYTQDDDAMERANGVVPEDDDPTWNADPHSDDSGSDATTSQLVDDLPESAEVHRRIVHHIYKVTDGEDADEAVQEFHDIVDDKGTGAAMTAFQLLKQRLTQAKSDGDTGNFEFGAGAAATTSSGK